MENRKPDFICIGPAKTGTTWIYENLKKHPDIYMPPEKELRYFWENQHFGNLGFWQRWNHKSWHFKLQKTHLKQRIKKYFFLAFNLNITISDILWEFRFMFGKRNYNWYQSLFRSGKISGDVTPTYSELSSKTIAHIKEHFPELKVIISMRDPIDRDWSRIKMNIIARRGVHPKDLSEKDVYNHIHQPAQERSNDYVNLIEKWEHSFGPENILILYYDDLKKDPLDFITNICHFVGVSPKKYQKMESLNKRVNKTKSASIPQNILPMLIDANMEKIKKLQERFPDHKYPKIWMEKYGINY